MAKRQLVHRAYNGSGELRDMYIPTKLEKAIRRCPSHLRLSASALSRLIKSGQLPYRDMMDISKILSNASKVLDPSKW